MWDRQAFAPGKSVAGSPRDLAGARPGVPGTGHPHWMALRTKVYLPSISTSQSRPSS